MADDHTHVWPPRPPAPLCQILKPAPWQVKAREEHVREMRISQTIEYNEQEMPDWNEWRAAHKAKQRSQKKPFERHTHKTSVSVPPRVSETQRGSLNFAHAPDLRVTREIPALETQRPKHEPKDKNLLASSEEVRLCVDWKRASAGRLPAPPSLGDTFELDEYFQLHNEEE